MIEWVQDLSELGGTKGEEMGKTTYLPGIVVQHQLVYLLIHFQSDPLGPGLELLYRGPSSMPSVLHTLLAQVILPATRRGRS